MRLTFLGTGASTSTARHNSAVALDGRLLLDGGAPLLVQLARAGLAPDRIETVLITHGHGDHIIGLGTFLIDRVLCAGPPLLIVGPAGFDEQLDQLCRVLWGDSWRTMGPGFQLDYLTVAAGRTFSACGYQIDVVEISHDNGHFHAVPSVGYVISDGKTRLGFTGDTAPGPWVEALLRRSDVAVVECTGSDPGPTHLSNEYVAQLTARHVGVRIILNHFWKAAPSIKAATVAEDLMQVDV
jgi:ribonuclease BN (tRNA processing enzyme)